MKTYKFARNFPDDLFSNYSFKLYYFKEKLVQYFFSACAFLTAACVLFVIGFIFYTAWPTFESQGIVNFLTGETWNYGKEIFGVKLFIIGTAALTAVSLVLAVPVSIFSAIFLSEIASNRFANIIRPLIELLVGIPSVVYGIFGLYFLADFFHLHVDPFINSILGFIPIFQDLNPVNGRGILLASVILAIMILPTIIALSQDAIKSVPSVYREASLALGATKWQTILKVVLPVASKGIMAGIVLGMMRAMGETMAIVMLLGNMPKVPGSILDTGYAMTSKILVDANFYMADPVPRSAIFAIAAVLFAVEIIFVASIRILGGKVN